MMRGVTRALVSAALLCGSAVAAFQTPSATYHESIVGTLVSFDMIKVPAGAGVAEFFIGKTEVTWDLYDVYALGLDREQGGTSRADAVARPSEPYGAPDRGWGHAGFPVMSVTREAAENFCRWLSARTGKAYRLPTEAEWARAASLAAAASSLTPARLDALAWHEGNAESRSHPVGKRAADALGLVDLFGNVAEWVTTANGARIVAGGSFRDAVKDVGPAARATQDPTWNQTDPQLPKSRWWLSDGPFAGFRLALTLTGVRP
jgi:formylglycine-generating enzyme required for sulfatase activity